MKSGFLSKTLDGKIGNIVKQGAGYGFQLAVKPYLENYIGSSFIGDFLLTQVGALLTGLVLKPVNTISSFVLDKGYYNNIIMKKSYDLIELDTFKDKFHDKHQ